MSLAFIFLTALLTSTAFAQPADESAQKVREYLKEPRIVLVEEPSELHSAIVICNALDADGDVIDGTTGLVIDDGIVLTSIGQLLNADSISVQSHCCDERAATGIIAFDMRTGLAKLRVPGIEAKPYKGGFSAMPETAPAEVQGVYGLPFRFEGTSGVVKTRSEVIGDWRHGEYPRTIVIRNSFRKLGAGGLIVDEAGKPFGMIGRSAGAGHMGVIPISAHEGLEPLDEPIRGLDVIEHTPDDIATAMVIVKSAAVARRGSPIRGAALARQAIGLDESNSEAHYELGVCLDLMGQKEDSLSSLERAVELDPHWSESWYSLGLVHLTNDEPAKAIESFEKAAACDPYYGDVHAMLGLSLVRDSRPDDGIKSMYEACKLEPGNLQFLYNLAKILEQHGRPDEIPDVWMYYVNDDPDDAERWQLALVQTVKARQYGAFQKMASEAESRLGEADALLGAIALQRLMVNQDLEAAEALANRALEIDPEDYLALGVQYNLEAMREQESAPPP